MTIASASQTNLLDGLNDVQREAVMAPLDSALRVMAGAGTGKTRIITQRFVKLMNDLESSDIEEPETRLWVSTFTVKAAEEMKARIIALMPQLSESARAGRLWIGTFHSLCQRILKDFPEVATRSLFSDIESNAFRDDLVSSALDAPLSLLSEIITKYELPVRADILSADTLLSFDAHDPEVLIREIVFDVIPRIKAAGLSPQQFYRQATEQAETLNRILETMPVSELDTLPWEEDTDYATRWQPHLKTVADEGFSFAPSTWQMEIEQRKKSPKSENALLRKTLKLFYDFGCYVTYESGGRGKKAKLVRKSKDFGFLADELAAEKNMIAVVAVLYAWYQHSLAQENAFDYDDLMLETIDLLKKNPNIQERYSAHFKHFLVDEFQDSNGLQLRLVQLFQTPGTPPRLTVVGDIKQSIYRFRFAEPQNLHVLFEDLPDTQTLHLSDNYRSHSDILAMANRITQMMGHESDHHLTARAGFEIQAPAIIWNVFEDAESTLHAKDEEAAWICENIQTLLDNKNYLPTDIAVLVPRNMRALDLEEALEACGIAAVKQRNYGFFNDPVINQAVWLFHLIDDPANDMAMAAVLQHKLTDKELAVLARYKKETRQHDWFEALTSLTVENAPAELKPCLPLFEVLVKTLSSLNAEKTRTKPDQLFTNLIDALPLIVRTEPESRPVQKTRRYLELIAEVIANWMRQSKTPRDLTQILKLLSQAQAKNELELPVDSDLFAEDAVRILTLHGAKGLEFPAVFLAGVQSFQSANSSGNITVDPQYPGKAGFGLFLNKHEGQKSLKRVLYETVWHKPREEAEQLRLFYVAVTRAKQQLFISSWRKSFAYMQPDFFQGVPIQFSSSIEVGKGLSIRD